MNRFREEDAGKHWGYPFCWSEFKLPTETGEGPGTVWAWPSFLEAGQVSDDECRQNYVSSILSMQAHSAPLGIVFFEWVPPEDLPAECEGSSSFPKEMDSYAFIAFHGSWNRDVPTGYKVVYVPMDGNGDVLGDPIDLLAHEPPNAQWEDGFRPVDVDFDDCGRLLVTSDGTRGMGSKIVRLEYKGAESPTPSHTETPVSSSPETPALSSESPAPSPASTEAPISSIAPSNEEPCPCVPTANPVPSTSGGRRRYCMATGVITLLFASWVIASK